MNKQVCPRCEIVFHSWSEYAMHMAEPCQLKLVPLKISNRSKEQIVADVEANLDPHLISFEHKCTGEPQCCERCFQKALDRLVSASEEALQ